MHYTLGITFKLPYPSGVNGKPVYCISFRLGTGYRKRHYIRLSTS